MRAVYNVPAFERSSTNEHAVATSEEEVCFNLHLKKIFYCEHYFNAKVLLEALVCKVNYALIWVESTPQRTIRDDEPQFDAKCIKGPH